jgi:hypothetical protein
VSEPSQVAAWLENVSPRSISERPLVRVSDPGSRKKAQ